MVFAFWNLVAAVLLVGAMLAMQRYGRYLATPRGVTPGSEKRAGGGKAEGAVFTVLGLLLAFTFSGAAARFDQRRYLVVDEANAIGTAWLRLDLLPPDRRAEVRVLFRQYVDARLETYRDVMDTPATERALTRSLDVQQEIWTKSLESAAATGQTAPFTVLLPSLNSMIDLMQKRTAITRFHPPYVIFGMIVGLALIAAIFSGFDLAASTAHGWIQRFGFALVIALTMYVIVDLEYPRLGLITVKEADQVLVELRRSMN